MPSARRFFHKARRDLGGLAKRNHLAQRLYDVAATRALTGLSGVGMYTGSGRYRRAYTRPYRKRKQYSRRVTANNLVTAGTAAGAIPTFSSKNDETGELRISHREYIRDIYGNAKITEELAKDFQNQEIELNPGLESSFPWLSQVAQNFEEYEFDQLIFTYRSTIADVSSNNGQVGTVIMATNYNPSEPSFGNKSMMMGYAHSASQKTTQNMLHGVECDPRKISGDKGKYVRAQGLDANQDIKSYDHGKFQLAIANTPVAIADNTIGELWVSYTVKLRKPKYFTKEGYGITRAIFRSKKWNDPNITWDPEGAAGHFGGDLPLSGIHNSIHPKIVTADAVTKIIFPAHYAGNLQVRIALMSRAAGGFNNNNVNPPWSIGATGNITLTEDMVGCVPYAGPSGIVGLNSNRYFTDPDIMELIVNIRVEIASNSKDNVLVLTLTAGLLAQQNTTASVLEMTEYNSTFGSNTSDAPQYVDSNGILQSF